MKGKKKAREVQPKAVTAWTLVGYSEVYFGDGVWRKRSNCAAHIAKNGYLVLRPIKVRIVPVLPKKRGARR